jgi:hypothetical protein
MGQHFLLSHYADLAVALTFRSALRHPLGQHFPLSHYADLAVALTFRSAFSRFPIVPTPQ